MKTYLVSNSTQDVEQKTITINETKTVEQTDVKKVTVAQLKEEIRSNRQAIRALRERNDEIIALFDEIEANTDIAIEDKLSNDI